jgi:hypothetical protein
LRPASTSAEARTGGRVIPLSRRIHDRANRLHNDRWLLEGDDMARLVGDDLTATSRQSNLVALQVSPCPVATSCTRHDHERNRQLTPSAPDLCGTLSDMKDFSRGRLVYGGAELRRARESTD